MSKPLIIAHRGLNLEAPENTLPAFQKAKEAGVDGVELDILPSKEGTLVVTHDENVFKFTGVKAAVKKMSLSELKKLDFGSHFSSTFREEKIPTLEEVFDLLGKELLINIEIKGTNIRSDGREETLIQLIRKWKMTERVVVSSFNIFSLKRMMQRAPDIKRGYLFYEKQDAISRRGGWAKSFAPYSFHISKALVKEDTVQSIHQRGYKCWVWTVNEIAPALALKEQGAEAMITDDPKKLLKAFSSSYTKD